MKYCGIYATSKETVASLAFDGQENLYDAEGIRCLLQRGNLCAADRKQLLQARTQLNAVARKGRLRPH